MPADSEPQLPELPITWRPLGPRVVGIAVGAGLLVICVFSWFTFDEETRQRFTPFQRGTLIALGLLAFALLLGLIRSRVEAHHDRLVVVNGYRRREYAWAQIVAVNLPPGAPWVTLDLADGDTASAMGIQGSDGARAQQAARELRRLVARLSDPAEGSS
ncbi:PH domain-containing protein [Nocardioides dilutus]